MRLVRIALLVAATGCAASSAARRESSTAAPVPGSREPLHITIVYPDTAEPIQTRLQLSRGAIAWVNTADVVPLAPGTPTPGGIVDSVRLIAGPRSLVLRVPLPTHVPYKVEEDEKNLTLRLYGVASDVNWMQYGGTDPYVTRMTYARGVARGIEAFLPEMAR